MDKTERALPSRRRDDDLEPAAPSPGKAPPTQRIAATDRRPPVQMTPASERRRSAADWASNGWMDAAHRGVAVQARGGKGDDSQAVHEAAAHGVSGSGAALPHLDKIQKSFGDHDLSGVRAHVGGDAAEASDAMGASAYATGNDIAFRDAPDLHTAAHEAAHVVQQRVGVQLAGGVGQAGDRYERQADEVADRVVRGESASDLLGGGAVQRKSDDDAVQRQEDVTIGSAEEQANTSQRREAVESLGDLQSFDDGFYPRAGRVLDAMLPNEGDKGKVQINLNLAVNPSVRISFQFIVEGERNADGLKARVEVGAGVTATVDLWVAEAFARAMVFGYLEAQGDTGEEVFRFLSYALYDRVAQVSADAADYVWGRAFRRRTRAMMDEGDYVESGLGAEVSAGISVGGGDQSMAAGVRGSVGTRITAGGRQDVSMLSGKLAVASGPWGGELQVQLTGGEGNESGEISFGVQRQANMMEFASVLEDGSIQQLMLHWVGGIVGTAQGLIAGTGGAQSRQIARRVGGVGRMISDGSLGLTIGSAAALRSIGQALSSLNAVNMGQKLTVKLGMKPNEISVEADLERISQIEFGENDRAPVYVSLENASRILKLGPGTAAI